MNMQSPYCLPLPSNLSHGQHYYQSLLHISRESRQQGDACISTYRHTPARTVCSLPFLMTTQAEPALWVCTHGGSPLKAACRPMGALVLARLSGSQVASCHCKQHHYEQPCVEFAHVGVCTLGQTTRRIYGIEGTYI